MPNNPKANAYADRVAARLRQALKKIYVSSGRSEREFEKDSGVAREMRRLILNGDSDPTIRTVAKFIFGSGSNFTELGQRLDEKE